MPANPPTIYVIAGCNGAGKTTFAKEFLPKEVKCLRFLNADEIARGLSPLKPEVGGFDLKTSSWLKTPAEIRKRGGALYGESRYGRIFIGHNGAQSYYAVRGFRGSLRV